MHTGLWSGSMFHVPPLAHTNIRCKVSPAMSVLGKMPTSQDASRRPNPSCNCHPCPATINSWLDRCSQNTFFMVRLSCGLRALDGCLRKDLSVAYLGFKTALRFPTPCVFLKKPTTASVKPKVPEAFLATFKKYFASLQRNNVQIKCFHVPARKTD